MTMKDNVSCLPKQLCQASSTSAFVVATVGRVDVVVIYGALFA
jgi:hypothetical protein